MGLYKKGELGNCTPHCMEFMKAFKAIEPKDRYGIIRSVTTHAVEYAREDGTFYSFDGAVYVDNYERVIMIEHKIGEYHVLTNLPDFNGDSGVQLFFGNYKTFNRALKRTVDVINHYIQNCAYPMPAAIY